MPDRYQESSFRPYRVPAEPDPEPSPGHRETYAPYDAPAPGAPPDPEPTPAASLRTMRQFPALLGVGVALVVVLGLGLVLGATTGPVDVETPTGTISVDSGTVKGHLEEKRAHYDGARRAGDLGSVGLTDDEFNDTAVVAFSYLLTDMIIAAGFGVDDKTAVEYARTAAEYERLLLAEEALGSDIALTFSEDRAFVYDGSTGEGGFVDPSAGD